MHKSKGILNYIHADLWGPARTPTQGGNLYFLSLIDEYSRNIWVYLLKNMSEALDAFRVWKKIVVTQTSRVVKALKIDNGLEVRNEKFDKFCDTNTTLRHRTIVYTPQ